MRGILKDLKRAHDAAEKAMNAHGGGMYERGLSSEGYAGGYIAALRDVEAALRGWRNTNSRYWPQT